MLAITGGTGFIGGYISRALSFPQKQLVRSAPSSPLPRCKYIIGDLSRPADREQLVADSSTLVHFACTTNPRSSNENLVADMEQNLISSVHLFEAFAKASPEGH